MKIHRNNPLITLIIFAVIITLQGCKKSATESPSQTTDVPVGVVVSLTGSFSPYGLIQQKGINLAIDEINAGNLIPGIRLVAHIADDKSNPDTCRAVFRDLIFNRKVLAIIGPTSSNSAFVADTVAQNNQVVVMGISNTVPGLTELGNYVFRNSLPENTVIPNTVKVTHEKLAFAKVSVIYGSDDPYTVGAYQSFRSALEQTAGVSIISTDTIHKGDTDFLRMLTGIRLLNPDVIVMATLVNETSLLMIKAREMGFSEQVRFIGGNSFNTAKLWQQAGNASQGAICGTAWIRTASNPGNQLFVQNYFTRYGTFPDQFAAQAYAGVYIFASAIKQASPLNRSTFRDALAATTNLTTVLGSFTFDANRDPIHPPVVQRMLNGDFILFE